jgi:hypothetical protein
MARRSVLAPAALGLAVVIDPFTEPVSRARLLRHIIATTVLAGSVMVAAWLCLFTGVPHGYGG